MHVNRFVKAYCDKTEAHYSIAKLYVSIKVSSNIICIDLLFLWLVSDICYQPFISATHRL